MEHNLNLEIEERRTRIFKYLALFIITVAAIFTSNVVFKFEYTDTSFLYILIFAVLNICYGLKDLTILDNGLEKIYRFNLFLETVCLLICGPIPTLVAVFISKLIYVPINEIKYSDKFSLLNIVYSICLSIVSVNVLSIVFVAFAGRTYDINFPENIFAILIAESFEFFTHTLSTLIWNSLGKQNTNIFTLIKKEYLWIARYDLWQTIYAILISNIMIVFVENIKEKFELKGDFNENDLFVLMGIFVALEIVYFPLKERAREFKMLIDFNRQNTELKHLSGQLRLSNKRVTRAFAAMLERRDPYTAGHSERVALYSTIMAKKIGFSDERLEQLEMAGLLHDIGKMGIDLKILNKPTKLTDKEYDQIKLHPTYGVELLHKIYSDVDKKDEEFNLICDIANSHHERWDGRGYPNNIAGEQISLEARILGLADTLDAMTSDRSYRKGLDFDVAIEEISKNSGIQFCPKVVEVFLECVEDGSLKIYKEPSVSSLLSSYK